MTPRSLVWIWFVLLVPLTVSPGWPDDTGGRRFNEQVTGPVSDAIAVRQATQKEEEQWRDAKGKLVALYEQMESERSRLKASGETLKEDIRAARDRIAEKEKQLADIEQIRHQIEPFLQTSLESLRQLVASDLPFLQQERRRRIDRLSELFGDPEVAVSEKYRKLMEALLVEAEYGNTIEVYQENITMSGNAMLVNIFRLGRISLFYQTLDQSSSGFFDVAAGKWRPLPGVYNRSIGTAIDIGSKRKPAELISLPLGRICPK